MFALHFTYQSSRIFLSKLIVFIAFIEAFRHYVHFWETLFASTVLSLFFFFFTGLCSKGSPLPVWTNLCQRIIIRVRLFTFIKVIKGVPLHVVLDWSKSQKLADILLNLLTRYMSPYLLLEMESTKCWETMSTLDSLLSLQDMLLLTVILFSGSCLSQILQLL